MEEKKYPAITKEGNNDSNISENKIIINEYIDNDWLELKEKISEMYNKGYLPLFLRLYNLKPTFYYAKFENNLKAILDVHLKLNGYNPNDKYTLINNGEIIDQNTPIDDLDLKPFSIINIIKE